MADDLFSGVSLLKSAAGLSDPGFVAEPEEDEAERAIVAPGDTRTLPMFAEPAPIAQSAPPTTTAPLKQLTFIADAPSGPTKYTTAAGSPLYVPKDRRPHIGELVNATKVAALLREIAKANVNEEERAFLTAAAQRHAVFNYELTADYYAHATPEMQRLMESSALVIVDVDQAIERGYVRLCESIRKAYLEELAVNA